MSESVKDRVEGQLHQAKGAIKAEVGKLTNNPDLQAEGETEKIIGKVQHKVGQVESVLEKE